MNIDVFISSVVALTLFGVYNGLIIKWTYAPVDDKEYWRKWWHRCALCIRLFIWLIVWFNSKEWQLTGIVMIFTSVEYNVSINLINGLKWWYIGTTSSTDKLIRKLFPFINW